MQKNNYLFELGREQAISIAEIFALSRLWSNPCAIGRQAGAFLILQFEKPIDPAAWMERLGGTIKIGEMIETKDETKTTVIDYLIQSQPNGKILFSINGNHAKKIALTIKQRLKKLGRSVRYIEAKNTATILHNRLVDCGGDLTIVGTMAFATKAIQDIEAYSKRDYNRPGRSAKRGMLPPKLARIMINVAEKKESAVICDPFCGSGTVLMEAALLGYTRLVGSDASSDAIADTKKSLAWIQKTHALQAVKYVFHKSDAQHVDTCIKPRSIDAIITEPYLGKPLRGNESKKQLEHQARELATLYTNAFDAFHHILAPDGIIVCIIPLFRHGETWIRVDCINDIERIGFKQMPLGEESASLLYARKNQHVGRELFKFSKTNSRAKTPFRRQLLRHTPPRRQPRQ